MKFHRKILGGVAALGLVGGLVLVSPGTAGAQTEFNTDVTCTGTDSTSEILIGQIGGSVSIPITVAAQTPASMAAGATEAVNFTWVLDPGQTLTDLAGTVSLTTLEATLDVAVTVSGGSGGPLAFGPTPITVGVDPPNYPSLEASGQITAGSSGEVAYTLTAGTINILAQSADGELNINMACQVESPSLGATTITTGGGENGGENGGGENGGGGGTTPTTSAPTTEAGSSQPRVTG